jgi:hypothetical protein
MKSIVVCIPIARQRLGKHIPVRASERKNRTLIVKQRISKHASLRIEAVFSVRPCKVSIKSVRQHRTVQSSSREVKSPVSGRQPAGI